MGETMRILNSGAEHIRAQSQIDAARLTTKSGNMKRAAQTALSQFARAFNNSKQVDAAGDEIGAISENIARNLDASTYGTLMSRVQGAEELGASVAAAAAAGVGGSTVEMYNAQLGLTESLNEATQDRNTKSDLYLASKARADTWASAWGSQDLTQDFADLDFTQYVDHKKLSGIAKWFALTATATATYFGGPQAGEAVAGAVNGIQDARNGNFEGARQSFDNAVVNAGQGLKKYTSMGDADHAGEAWGKGTWDSTKNLLNNIRIK